MVKIKELLPYKSVQAQADILLPDPKTKDLVYPFGLLIFNRDNHRHEDPD